MNHNSLLMLWNQEQMFHRILKLLANAQIEVLAFLNGYTLTITTDDERYQIPKNEARKRGVKLRYITEITSDNLSYCKRQLDLVDELRHFSKIKGNFLMSESEFMASLEISPRHPITDGYYTNIKKIVRLQGYIFETLWESAIPATERIRQLESRRDKPSHVAEEGRSKKVVDRFYVCPQCNAAFIYADEEQEHQLMTGHKKAKEFPFFD